MNVEEFRSNFPIASKATYFDSAATSLTPEATLQKELEYYHEYRANIRRGAHRLTERASNEYEKTYETMARFFNAKNTEFVNVKNATEAINHAALGLDFSQRQEIVTTNIEHHSNLLPWMRLEQQGKAKLKYVQASREGAFNLEHFKNAITRQTALVTITAASNVLGCSPPVREIAQIAHDNGALVLIDAAQAVGHQRIDLKKWNCDLMAFSAHKCFGPTGIGALYHGENVPLQPALFGGGTITEVQAHSFKLVQNRERFEAGTPNIAGWIATGTALEFVSRNFEFILEQERKLVNAMMQLLQKPKAEYYGPRSAELKNNVFAFNIGKLKHHEVAVMFDQLAKICVRSGHHCAMPLHKELLQNDGSVRASLHAYNTTEEVSLFLQTLDKISRLA